MNERDDLDRLLGAWTDELYAAPSSRILGKVLEETRQTRQRRAWASIERWLPMTVITRPAAVPLPLRVVYLVVVTFLILALAASAALVGSQLLRATAVIPTGDAAVFAFANWIGGDAGQTGGDIHTVRADGTDLRRLTDGPGLRSAASWSPDGDRIAYRLWRDGADSVEVIDAGGGDLRTLSTVAQGKDCIWGWSLAWSPDGSSLIFPTRDGCTGDYGLSVVATDGSSPPVALLPPGLSSLHGRWSPDGTRIAFLGQEGNSSVSVYVIDDVSSAEALVGGLEARRIGPDLGSILDEASGPHWSPDGSELLVAGSGAVSQPAGEVLAIKADGSGERLVTDDGVNPTWSPDGTHIAFHRFVDPDEYFNNRPCTVRTWIVDATGANERALENRADPCGFQPVWSPDGSRIVDSLYVAAPDETVATFHLGIRSVDGDEVTAILPDGTQGSWQPVAAPLPPAPSFAAASPSS